jgi:multidrug transporter EmrE-like cation transporter
MEMTDMFGAFLLLGVAIVIEVCATALLPKAEGFTNAGWPRWCWPATASRSGC